ncbi:lanc-like protein 2 [Stylonychia lemnae]|uniref:Lanc-like protein 2 n=1 Tax=Stylonychia lemnae TaxID=5949 RepID=A0A078BA43_STYLE|nr:lanc-like protein 2 [Stylonychia lemnae]|eukprot:CDW91116.1 lanc-like protein 2 [Stylonychia lemnae]
MQEQIAIKISQSVFKTFDDQYETISLRRVFSDNKQNTDTSIYTGSGGVVYTYYQIMKYLNLVKEQKDLLEHVSLRFQESLELNIKMIEEGRCKKGLKNPSFFQSVAGLYTIGALHYHEQKNQKEQERMLDKLLEHYYVFENDLGEYAEDEILYGISGYLYCLLEVISKIDAKNERALKRVHKIIDTLLMDGTQWSQSDEYILIKWPRDRKEKKFYMGGAHGLIGVLQILLQAVNIIPDLKSDKNLMLIIKNSCEFVVEMQLESGNFPSSLGKKDDILVHFCHGSTGASSFLVSAYQTFKEQKYLDSLFRAGELIWEKGLLKKGNGICHGISGNAYALHSIYRLTNDEKWLNRSLIFIKATFDSDIQQICADYDDQGRIIPGVPDCPYSLMEGIGGQLVLYSQALQEDMNSVKFPGYEIIF